MAEVETSEERDRDPGEDVGYLLSSAIDAEAVETTLRKYAYDCFQIMANNGLASALPMLRGLAQRVALEFMGQGGSWNTPDRLGRYLIRAMDLPEDTDPRASAEVVLIGLADEIRGVLESEERDDTTPKEAVETIEASLEWIRNAFAGIPNVDADGNPHPDFAKRSFGD